MALELWIPRRLESPNTWNGCHWRVKHRITTTWQQEIGVAMLRQVGLNHQGKLSRAEKQAAREGLAAHGYEIDKKVRVTVQRYVPSARNFIKDDDNLRFSVKPLMDALTRYGLLNDDSRKWVDHPTPTQHVSKDGKDWTVVTIEPVEV